MWGFFFPSIFENEEAYKKEKGDQKKQREDRERRTQEAEWRRGGPTRERAESQRLREAL